MTSPSIEELLEMVEKATGPDRELDAAVYRALLVNTPMPNGPPYTASLDAALALVERLLPTWSLQLTKDGAGWEACLSSNDGAFLIKGDTEVFGCAATAPLALMVTLIRALQAKGGDHG